MVNFNKPAYIRSSKFLLALKYIFISITILFITASVNAQVKRQWVARINGGAFLSLTNLSLEKTIGKRHSVSIIPAFGYFRSEQFTYKTYGIGTEYRYYFSKNMAAPAGFYTAAGASYANGKADIETKNEKYDVKGYTIQLVGGKQWIFKKGFTIDAHIGGQYINLNVKGVDYKQTYKWILPAIGAGIGYAF